MVIGISHGPRANIREKSSHMALRSIFLNLNVLTMTAIKLTAYAFQALDKHKKIMT